MYDDDVVVKLLKEVSTVYKRAGLGLDPEWRWYVSLETCGGYRDPRSGPDLLEEARRWVGEEKVYDPAFTTSRAERWRMLDSLVGGGGFRPRKLTLREFLADPTRYATMGSGRGLPKLEVTALEWDEGWLDKERKLKSSKWAGYLASDIESLVKLASMRVKQQNWMFVKPDEPAKIRTIVVGDQTTYLIMSFLDYYVSAALDGNEKLPITWGSEERRKFWIQYARAGADESLVKVPIDQSAFDENVSLELVLDVVSWLGDLAVRNGAGEEGRMLADNLIFAMNGGVLWADDVAVPIRKGVLSGWKWTALIDSLANYVQFEEIRRGMGIAMSDVRVSVFQGDDVDCAVRTYEQAAAFMVGYERYGLDVNPNKTFIDRTRDEFLRLVAEGGEVRGYPARTVTGLLFQRPNSARPSPEMRVQEQVTSWMKLLSRGADRARVTAMMVEELARVLKLESADARALLHSPRAVGGMGVTPFGSRWLGLVPVGTGARKPKILSVKSPLLADLGATADEQARIVGEVLASQLVAPPMRVREYSVSRTKPDLRIGKDVLYSTQPTRGIIFPSPPRPKWKSYNNVYNMLVRVRAREDPDVVYDAVSNPSTVAQAMSMLGKRLWYQWLSGPIQAAPVSEWNDAIAAPTADSQAGRVWKRVKRWGPQVFKLFIEISSQKILAAASPFIGT